MENPGKVINDAQEIIKKIYKETYRLKDDFAELVADVDATLTYTEEYSYGTKYLHLKSCHCFIFSRDNETNEEQIGVALIVVFYDDGDLKRINLKDQPELWVASYDVRNRENKVRPWEMYWLLKSDERENFENQVLKVGGEICNYSWVDDEGDSSSEKWDAKFVGFPLVDVTDKNVLKEKIIDKLFTEE